MNYWKELRHEDWPDERYMKFRGCMQREAEMGASVEHKNVVRAYTLEHKGQHLYLVTEHTDGPSLAELLEEGL